MISKYSQLKKVQKLLEEKCELGFYGEVVVKFEGGRIVYARIAENIKPTTPKDALTVVEDFFNKGEKVGENTVLLIKKINGKPHIGVTTSGQIDTTIFQEIPSDMSVVTQKENNAN